MKTGDLIGLLAQGIEPVARRQVGRRFGIAASWALAGAGVLMALFLGIRPDVATAATLPAFWVKVLFVAGVVVAAAFASVNLARPGLKTTGVAFGVLLPVVAIWLLAAWSLASADPARRLDLVLGQTWRSCPFNIAGLALPGLVALLWAMRRAAPVRPAWAGAAAGLFAGAVAALIYTLHCPEMAYPFLAVWYLAGMLVPALIGALIGPRLLRW